MEYDTHGMKVTNTTRGVRHKTETMAETATAL